MDLRAALLKEHSKIQNNKIVKWIGNDPKRFKELFQIFLNDEIKIVQRASWALSESTRTYPELIKPHLKTLFKNLSRPGHHNSVTRNSLRALEFIDIPDSLHGEVLNLCFNFISDPKEKPAIKAFSLTVLDNLSRKYPEIRHELRLIIEDQWENESAAFRSRARKIIGKNPSK